ncbi:mannanase [candidate division KSB1 bacterium]|nr:mannanase [candidate division KSB1 bacterium]
MCDTANNSRSSFVTVDGTQFMIDGEPYYFLGTNMWYGANLGMEGEKGDRERLIKELDLLREIGVTNLRVMGASEGLGEYRQVKPAIQPYPGEYNEDVLVGLDFLLDEMSKRGMYAVIFLNNNWVWTGGFSQYVSWMTGEEVPNPFKEEYSWSQFMNFTGRFYVTPGADELYRTYLKSLITRVNTINGRPYRSDPTIMSWQLANEPRPRSGENDAESIEHYLRWVHETAAYIKSLDPDHLVSTGNEGLAGSLQSEDCYLRAHEDENIDYMTFHLWLLNWSWFDPKNAEATYPQAEANAMNYIEQHIQYAEKLKKPITMEEFGIPRDMHSFSPKASTSYRDRYFKTVFDAIHESARNNSPFAGSNFWAWGGYGRASDPEGEAVWKENDDFTGDPPQEPQGRNSVFAYDKSTIQLLIDHGSKMRALMK